MIAVLVCAGACGGSGAASPDGAPVDAVAHVELGVEPQLLRLATVPAGGESAPMSLHVTVSGEGFSGPVEVRVQGAQAQHFRVEAPGCAALARASDGCEVRVRFAPQESGLLGADLVVSAAGTAATARLEGIALVPLDVTLQPRSWYFGREVIATAHQPPLNDAPALFTLANRSSHELPAFTAEVVGDDAQEFAVENESCGSSVPAARDCVVRVQFRPTSRGEKAATLRIRSGTTTLLAALTGRSVTPPHLVVPEDVSFGAASAPGAFELVEIRNDGEGPTGALTVDVEGPQRAAFVLTEDGCNERDLDGGQACTIKLGFAPANFGMKAATLRVKSASGVSAAVPLAGLADDASGLSALTLSSDGELGLVVVGGPPVNQGVKVTNDSNGLVTLLGATVEGDVRPGEITVVDDACPATLEPGESCLLAVQVLAQAHAGPPSWSVKVAAQPGAPAVRELKPRFLVDVSPLAMDFGRLPADRAASGPISFTFRNQGTEALPEPMFDLTGTGASQYVLESSACRGPIIGECKVRVLFAPRAAGEWPASLRVLALQVQVAEIQLSGARM
jgi:hypothetical protein